VERIYGGQKIQRPKRYSAGGLTYSPLVYDPDVHPGLRQPVRTHEPSRASTYDEDIYVGPGRHDWGMREIVWWGPGA